MRRPCIHGWAQAMDTWLFRAPSMDAASEFKAEVGFFLDPLSSIWLLFVTGVGSLIHIYSTGYMADEGGYYRFFGYLNLFMFAMLILVLGEQLRADVRRVGRRGTLLATC